MKLLKWGADPIIPETKAPVTTKKKVVKKTTKKKK
jgi:hypothetical protein